MIFIDTTIWVSAADESDNLHTDGSAVIKALSEERLSRAVTTDFVLDETLTILRKRHAKSSSISKIAGNILSSSKILIVYVDAQLFMDSLITFKKYENPSFTDSVSLTVMRQLKIREIYSHDGDFDLKGFVRKERPDPAVNV